MKKKLLFTILCSLSIVQFGCKNTSEKNDETITSTDSSKLLKNPNFCSLTQETLLDFGASVSVDSNVYIYSLDQLNAGEANFFNYYKYENAGQIQSLDNSNQQLSVADISALYAIIKTDPSVAYDSSIDYSALRMIFGMEAKKIIIIYEPVVLKPTNNSNECSVVTTNKFYRTQANGTMTIMNANQVTPLVNTLRTPASKIYITHPDEPANHKFINSEFINGDTKSTILSLQEIVRMYCDNGGSGAPSDKINFSVVADNFHVGVGNYKMHVVANYNIGQSAAVAEGSFQNCGADFGQLCPPNCKEIYINYYSNDFDQKQKVWIKTYR